MSSEYRSERDLSPAELVELEKAKKKMEHWKTTQPDHEISDEEGALGLLRMSRLTIDEEMALRGPERDAYYDAPATAEEKEQVRQMLAGEGEWADTGHADYPKEVILGGEIWPDLEEYKRGE